jgi:hypothetical protein
MKKSTIIKRAARKAGYSVHDLKAAQQPAPGDLGGIPLPSVLTTRAVWTAQKSIAGFQETVREAIRVLEESSARAQVLASSKSFTYDHLDTLATSISVLASHLRTEVTICKADLSAELATRNP